MLFLVELDHVRSGLPVTPESGRTFIEQVILPTRARGETRCWEENRGRRSCRRAPPLEGTP